MLRNDIGSYFRILKIAGALDIPVAALFTMDAVSVVSQNVTVGKINAQLTGVSKEEQKDILRIIRIFRGYQRKNNVPSDMD